MVQAVVQTTVTGLQGHPIAATAPTTANQALTWSGSAWAPGGPFLPLSGGVLTGPLTLAGNATGALNPVPLQQLQAGYLPLTGGTISGNLTISGSASIGGSGITYAAAGQNNTPQSMSFGIDNELGGGGFFGVAYNSSPGFGSGWLVRSYGVAGSWSQVVAFAISAGGSARVDCSATLSYTWSTVQSDVKAKDNLINCDLDALETVRSIPVYSCDYKPLGGGGKEHWDYTIIAQDVRRKMPYAFMEAPNETSYASVHPLHLITVLWRAVQQLSERPYQGGVVPSDPRLKTNSANYAPGVSVISQLQPITFEYNGLGGTSNDAAATPPVTSTGFDASAVQTVLPQAVKSYQGKLNPGDASDTSILSIDLNAFWCPVVNAISQLLQRVQKLESAANITPTAAETA